MIDLDLTMAVQLVNFIITLVVLNMLLIRPVRELIRKRHNTLEGLASDAAELNGRAEKALKDYQNALQGARETGAALRKSAREDAEAVGQTLIGEASASARERVHAAAEAAAADAARSRDALRADVPNLVQAVLTRLVGSAGKAKKVKA